MGLRVAYLHSHGVGFKPHMQASTQSSGFVVGLDECLQTWLIYKRTGPTVDQARSAHIYATTAAQGQRHRYPLLQQQRIAG